MNEENASNSSNPSRFKEQFPCLDKTDFSKKDDTKTADESIFVKIQKQRHEHRDKIFKFALCVARSSIIFTFLLVIIQLIVRIWINDYRVLDNYQLEIIFGFAISEVFGIIAVITKAIWNDSNYTDLLYKEYSDKKKPDK